MKKNGFIASMAVIVFGVTGFMAFTSCSSDEFDNYDEMVAEAVKEDYLIEDISGQSYIADSLRVFLSGGNVLSRATVENEWNFDEIIGIADAEKGLYTYMMTSSENPEKIVGGLSREKGEISDYFYFEKKGEYYTLSNREGSPVFDVEFNAETREFRYVTVYGDDVISRGKRPKVDGVHELCVAGVTAAGWLVGIVGAPETLGMSLLTALTFSAVSEVVCEDY